MRPKHTSLKFSMTFTIGPSGHIYHNFQKGNFEISNLWLKTVEQLPNTDIEMVTSVFQKHAICVNNSNSADSVKYFRPHRFPSVHVLLQYVDKIDQYLITENSTKTDCISNYSFMVWRPGSIAYTPMLRPFFH